MSGIKEGNFVVESRNDEGKIGTTNNVPIGERVMVLWEDVTYTLEKRETLKIVQPNKLKSYG